MRKSSPLVAQMRRCLAGALTRVFLLMLRMASRVALTVVHAINFEMKKRLRLVKPLYAAGVS